MYAVRDVNGTTRWAEGTFRSDLGYYIKYPYEYDMSTTHMRDFTQSGLRIDDFYKTIIK